MHDTVSRNRRQYLIAALMLPVAGMAMAGIARASTALPLVEVWKDPNCGCCNDWVTHMQQAGFTLRVHETGNTQARARLGIPTALGSCHTARVDGYALEGHVPAREVLRLLKERPPAVGLATPGMPVGSPGMDGALYGGRKDPYDVLLVQADGRSVVYQAYR